MVYTHTLWLFLHASYVATHGGTNPLYSICMYGSIVAERGHPSRWPRTMSLTWPPIIIRWPPAITMWPPHFTMAAANVKYRRPPKYVECRRMQAAATFILWYPLLYIMAGTSLESWQPRLL